MAINSNSIKKFINKYYFGIISLVTLIVFLIGYSVGNLYVSAISVYLYLVCLLGYCIKNKKILMLLFCLTLCFFVLDRPISTWILGKDLIGELSEESVYFTLFVCELCMISLWAGDYLFNKFDKTSEKKKNSRIDINSLRIALLVIIVCSGICFGISQADKIIFFSNHNYADLYTEYVSSVPSIVRIGARFFPYAVISYLATSPKMSYSIITLILLIASRIPDVMIGARQWLVLYFIFAIVYIWLRMSNSSKKLDRKIVRRISIVIVSVALVGVIVLGKIGYSRLGDEYDDSPLNFLPNIAYVQSISFDTIRQIYDYRNELPTSLFRNYSFGNVIETVGHNKITETLFNVEPISNFNSISRATSGNSMAHQISYLVLGNLYLEGYGVGTSYLGEAFVDAGYLGVIILSLIIGYFMAYVSKHSFNSNWLVTVIKLYILITLFYLPRESFGAVIDFLLSASFWITIIGALILSLAIDKLLTNGRKSNNIKA